MSDASSSPLLRIGSFSRRVGVSAERLRTWERRYGVPYPQRTEGGFRLYSVDDEDRVRAMLAELERGTAPAEAASIALGAAGVGRQPRTAPADGAVLAAGLRTTLERYDARGAQTALDEAMGRLSLEAAIRDVVLPCMREIGDRWAQAEITVGQEQFASRLVEGRLLAAARGWETRGGGPTAVLACPPGELHTIGLITFGLVLSLGGWRILYLGADTPVTAIRDTSREARAEVVVLSSAEEMRFASVATDIRDARLGPKLYFGGAGSNPALAEAAGAEHLAAGAVEAAEEFDPMLRRRAAPVP